MDEITDEIIEKARNGTGCPFCGGFVWPEEIDDTRSKVWCVNCGRVWVEIYDEEGNLIDMEPSND